jgi:hypothetical protein
MSDKKGAGMRQLSRTRLWFNNTAANPPIWMRLLYVR